MSSPFPPQPSVEHLVTIFRRISACNILIPAFQRSFVWREAQVLALMESVYQGFPIGSVLLWRVDGPILRRNEAAELPFPRGKIHFPADFVLDGLQRLSSLYGVFHFGEETNNSKFDVLFDLKSKRFVNSRDTESDDDRDYFVPLNTLFSPRKLIDIQQRILKRSDGEQRIEQLLTLQSRFQEYMLPMVTLSRRKPEEVVSIFERINSTGTRLSSVDFMRAITWSSEFDLNRSLSDLSSVLSERDFDVSEDTLVKALALTFDLTPLPNVMLRLREQPAAKLQKGMKRVTTTCLRVIDFLDGELGIKSSDYVPYEGQFLVLFNVLDKLKKVDKRTSEMLARWFMSVSINESLQGRPDHYVARMVTRITAEAKRGVVEVPAVRTDSNALVSRRTTKSTALTSAFVTTLARAGARDLGTGEIIPSDSYMTGFASHMIASVLDVDALREIANVDLGSAKTIANSVLEPTRGFDVVSLISKWANEKSGKGVSVLESQLIPLDSAKCLVSGRKEEFIEKRAAHILREVERYIE